MTRIEKLQLDAVKVSALTKKDEVIVALENYGLKFDAKSSITELKTILIKHILTEIAQVNIQENTQDEQKLAAQAEKIIADAEHLQESFEKMSEEERAAYFQILEEQNPALAEIFDKHFPKFKKAGDYTRAATPATDLPFSEIIQNLPIRVVEQVIISQVEEYPLANQISIEMVRNGMKEVFYNDFTATDNESGFGDVKIGDYNPALSPVFKDTYKVDTEIHKGMPILDRVLNDITLTPATFVAIINNVVWGIGKPISHKLFQEFVAYLDTDANYDESIAMTGTDAKGKAKEVLNKMYQLGQTSRGHLKATFDGKKLEHRLISQRASLILNSKYATDYKYDLSSMTFQLGEITLPVKSIQIVDFEELKEYAADPATSKLGDIELIIAEDKHFNMIGHYQATKVVNTTRMKSVMHTYMRYGIFKRKNRYLGKFTKPAAPTGSVK